jgi:hypothetical protein
MPKIDVQIGMEVTRNAVLAQQAAAQAAVQSDDAMWDANAQILGDRASVESFGRLLVALSLQIRTKFRYWLFAVLQIIEIHTW